MRRWIDAVANFIAWAERLTKSNKRPKPFVTRWESHSTLDHFNWNCRPAAVKRFADRWVQHYANHVRDRRMMDSMNAVYWRTVVIEEARIKAPSSSGSLPDELNELVRLKRSQSIMLLIIMIRRAEWYCRVILCAALGNVTSIARYTNDLFRQCKLKFLHFSLSRSFFGSSPPSISWINQANE